MRSRFTGSTNLMLEVSQRFRAWRERARRESAGWREQRKMELALAELRTMSDAQLADIGLSRSQLTREGLSLSAERRRMVQECTVIFPFQSASNDDGSVQ